MQDHTTVPVTRCYPPTAVHGVNMQHHTTVSSTVITTGKTGRRKPDIAGFVFWMKGTFLTNRQHMMFIKIKNKLNKTQTYKSLLHTA
jgi:hypothetical protein